MDGLTIAAADSFLVRGRSRAAILVALITFGLVCHAEMTHQDACQAELANCRALLGAVGAKEAKDVVHLAAVIDKTGTPSSASKGARLRSPPIFLACTDSD
jgi:hypothetical protein